MSFSLICLMTSSGLPPLEKMGERASTTSLSPLASLSVHTCPKRSGLDPKLEYTAPLVNPASDAMRRRLAPA